MHINRPDRAEGDSSRTQELERPDGHVVGVSTDRKDHAAHDQHL